MEDLTYLSEVYNIFFSKVTDDLYMELTYEDTVAIVKELLDSAIQWFEFPRKKLTYHAQEVENSTELVFDSLLTDEEKNILATYMIVEWLGQQIATVELVRMKYSGADFKFTSQANHLQKLLQQKKDYERVGFHLQRLYKRRKADSSGVYKSTFGEIMASSI